MSITRIARSRSARARVVIAGLAVLMGAGLLGACSDDATDSAARTTTTFETARLAADCSADSAPSTTLPPERCLNAAFIATVNGKDIPAAVRKLGEAKQLAFGQGICAFAHVVASGGAPAPVLQRFLDETAKSWKQPKVVVEAIYRNASVLCPTDYPAIANLPKSASGSVTVAFSVTGNGKATVTYTLPNGSTTQEQVAAPWNKLVHLDQVIAMQIDVRPDEHQALSCAIAVNNDSAGTSKQVAAVTGKAGELTTCQATVDAIDLANAGN